MSINRFGSLRSLLLAGASLAVIGGMAVPAMMPGNAVAEVAAADSLLGPDGSYAEIVRRTRPAVVTVTTQLKAAGVDMQGQYPEEFFRHFFGQEFGNGPFPFPIVPGNPGGPQGRQGGAALGSGFIIDPEGLIVTNNHVIDNAAEITVTLDDGRAFPATLVGADPKTDIAVLRIKAKEPLPYVAWGDSDKVAVGDHVIAIGNPFGVGTTVTSGIVSARGRDLRNGPYDDFLQLDAAINHGNSGGAVIATDGKVVGISTAILSPDGNSVGLGFAIPSDMARDIVAKIEATGTVERGFLGVRIQPVGADIAKALGLKEARGALVAEVTPDTPAAAAGIRQGDVVLAVDGRAMDDARMLTRTIGAMAPGSRVDLTVWRDGQTLDVKLALGTMPGEETAQSVPSSATVGHPAQLGLSLEPLTPEMRRQLGLSDGQDGVVVTAVEPDSAAAEKGLSPGDVVLSAANLPVASPDAFADAVKKAESEGKGSVLLLVEHEGQQMFVALPVSQS